MEGARNEDMRSERKIDTMLRLSESVGVEEKERRKEKPTY